MCLKNTQTTKSHESVDEDDSLLSVFHIYLFYFIFFFGHVDTQSGVQVWKYEQKCDIYVCKCVIVTGVCACMCGNHCLYFSLRSPYTVDTTLILAHAHENKTELLRVREKKRRRRRKEIINVRLLSLTRFFGRVPQWKQKMKKKKHTVYIIHTCIHTNLLFHTVQTRMFRCNRFQFFSDCINIAYAHLRYGDFRNFGEYVHTRTMSIRATCREILSNSIRFWNFFLYYSSDFLFLFIFPSQKKSACMHIWVRE